jgi:hypothetical protein
MDDRWNGRQVKAGSGRMGSGQMGSGQGESVTLGSSSTCLPANLPTCPALADGQWLGTLEGPNQPVQHLPQAVTILQDGLCFRLPQ